MFSISRASFPIGLLLCHACIGVQALPGSSGELQLTASDWLGAPQDPAQLPRRPHLQLAFPGGLKPVAQSVVLFPGTPSGTWIEDLARAPLSAEHAAQLVPHDELWTSDGVRVTPYSALEPGSAYVLAVSSWARTRRNMSLNRDGAPTLFALQTAAAPEAGARVVASWPADGTSGVATNLAAGFVAFDGAVQTNADGIWLQDGDGSAVAAEFDERPCGELGAPPQAVTCVQLVLAAELAPNAPYALVIGDGVEDSHGAPLAPWRAEFHTGSSADLRPPVLRAPDCAIDEQALALGCALLADTALEVRLVSDEAAIAVLRSGARLVSSLGAEGSSTLRLADLVPDRDYPIELGVRDFAGNVARDSFTLRTTPALAALSINEVRADPRGPEPAQEFVELFNYGSENLDLSQFTLSDRADAAGQPIADPRSIAPQGRALLVADDFDPQSSRDVPPLPGTALVRVGRALAGSGLSNAGERLFLRDRAGHRISASPATPMPRPGVCIVRVSDDPRAGAPGSFDYDPDQSCTPGW